MEDLWKQVLTALIPAIGTYLVAKSNNKISGNKNKDDHSLELFNEYKGLIDNLSKRVTTLMEDLEESEERNDEYEEEISALNKTLTRLNQENFVLLNQNEMIVKDNLRLEKALERMHQVEVKNKELEDSIYELHFEIEVLEDELSRYKK